MRHALLFSCESLHAKLLIKLSLSYTSQQCVMMMEEICIAALHVVGLAARISANFRKNIFPLLVRGNLWFGYFLFVCVL